MKIGKKLTAFAVMCLLIGMALLFVPFGDNDAVAQPTDEEPLDIVVSNVRNMGFTVSWMTEGAVNAYLEVNIDGTWTQFNDPRPGPRRSHWVNVGGLAVAAANYDWRIVSDGVTYQDDGTSIMGIGVHNQEYNAGTPGVGPWITRTKGTWTPSGGGNYIIFTFANDGLTAAENVITYSGIETSGGVYSNVLSGLTDIAYGVENGGQFTFNAGDYFVHTAGDTVPGSLMPTTGDYIMTRVNGGQWDGVASSSTGVNISGLEYPFTYPGAWNQFNAPAWQGDFYNHPGFGGPDQLVLGPYSLPAVAGVDVVIRDGRGYQMIAVPSTVSIGTASGFAAAVEAETGRQVFHVSDFVGGKWVDYLHRGSVGELVGVGDFALTAGYSYLVQFDAGAVGVTWVDAFPVAGAPVTVTLEVGWNNVGVVHTDAPLSVSTDIIGTVGIDRVAVWDNAWITDPGVPNLDLQTDLVTANTYLMHENAHGFFVRSTTGGEWAQT